MNHHIKVATFYGCLDGKPAETRVYLEDYNDSTYIVQLWRDGCMNTKDSVLIHGVQEAFAHAWKLLPEFPDGGNKDIDIDHLAGEIARKIADYKGDTAARYYYAKKLFKDYILGDQR